MPSWKLGLVKIFAAPFLFLLSPIFISGRRRVPRSGGVLIIANHLSSLDPVLIQWACPRHVFYMAETELWDIKGVRRILQAWQAFPVLQDKPDRKALRRAIELLRQGHVVCIFPEGGLSPTEDLAEFKGGVKLIVRDWEGPVQLCKVVNSRKVIPYGSMTPRPGFTRIRVKWGEARSYSKEERQRLDLNQMRQELEVL